VIVGFSLSVTYIAYREVTSSMHDMSIGNYVCMLDCEASQVYQVFSLPMLLSLLDMSIDAPKRTVSVVSRLKRALK
jgi:hypothetical protein